MNLIIDAALWFATVSAALMAGVYFCFSAFVMRSLDAIEPPAGMLAMQSINRVILKSAFLPIFFASSAICLVLVAIALADPSISGASALIAGSGLYVVGMFVVTVAANVPLNNTLEATAASGPDGATMWRRYMRNWIVWNHVRTASCIVSTILLIVALIARG